MKKYICPVCGYRTLGDSHGHFDICPVCFWEDDNLQCLDFDYAGGANRVSVNQARENYKKFGAKEKRVLPYVRPPRPEEFTTATYEEEFEEPVF